MNSRAWVAFAVVAGIWGTPYLLIKVAVDGGMPPLVLAWVRLLLALVLLAAIAWRAGTLPPLRSRLRWIALYALFELVIPFPMLGFGEERIDSSVAAILIATAPLIVAVLALRFEPAERVGGRRLVGLLVGLAGVAALVGVHLSGSGEELLGIGAVFVAATGYAIGPMILRRHFADLDPIASMAAAMGIGALALTPFAAATLPDAAPSDGAIASVVVLGVVCTALTMVAMAILVREAGAGRALLVTYVNPVIAVALGVIFLDEEPGAGAIVGLAAILAGSWLASRGEPPVEIEPDAVAIREPATEPPLPDRRRPDKRQRT